MHGRAAPRSLIIILAFLLAACEESGPTVPSYSRDIAPLFATKCVSCHTEGAIAPFALDHLDAFVPRAALIRRAVLDRTMPPWPPSPDCNAFLHDRSLSESEIERIVRWIDAGTPPGAPRPETALASAKAVPFLPDRTLTIGTPYLPPPGPDQLRCFPIEWSEGRPTFIRGYRVVPGNPSIVHRVHLRIARRDQRERILLASGEDPRPGFDCGRVEGFFDLHHLGVW